MSHGYRRTLPRHYDEYLTVPQCATRLGMSEARVVERAGGAQYFGCQLLVAKPVDSGPGLDEVQSLVIGGSPNSGTFVLIFDGQPTAKIAYYPSATQLRQALEALPNIGAGTWPSANREAGTTRSCSSAPSAGPTCPNWSPTTRT